MIHPMLPTRKLSYEEICAKYLVRHRKQRLNRKQIVIAQDRKVKVMDRQSELVNYDAMHVFAWRRWNNLPHLPGRYRRKFR